jgi:hypothetical protein
VDAVAAPIPEPGGYAFLIVGLLTLFLVVRRRRPRV